MVAALTKQTKPTYFMSRFDALTQNMFNATGFQRVADIGDADVVIFPGGYDVNPFLYGAKRHPTTQVDYFTDMEDLKVLKQIGDYQAKLGICRGAQFLNCLVGNGKLYQHVTDHAIGGYHTMYASAKVKGFAEEVEVTSTHHQMMIPGQGAEVIYCANISMSKATDEKETIYSKDTRAKVFDDVEVVYYPDRTTLCYQPHPEYLGKANYFNREVFFGLVCENLLDGNLAEDVWERFYDQNERP